jgi:pilus assembly protein CpaB
LVPKKGATIAMDVKKIVLLVGALLIAAVTAIMAKNMFTGASAPEAQATPQQAPQGPEVLVATRTLPVGTIIDAEAFRYQPWPQGLVQDAYFTRGEAGMDPQSLIGTVVRNEISAGQPLSQGAIVRPGERGFLAAALGPGMRAVTVGVSATSGVAGFVFPGDRVDLVLTQEVTGNGDSGPPLRASETIIRNIRVLAVDQRLNSRDEAGNQVAQTVATITFEATPKIAEKIAVAQTIGQLSLSLRSLADNNAELERAIASGEVTVPNTGDPRAERQLLLQVATRPIDTGTTFTVGADVSRFQRSSVPSRQRSNDNGNNASAGRPAPSGLPTDQPMGPVVRIARGNNVTVVPVGAR